MMKNQKLFSLVFALTTSIGFVCNNTQAATDRSELMVYKFQETKPATIENSMSYMKQFLPSETANKLEETESSIVRYVSEKDVNTTLEHNLVTGDLSFHRNFSRYLGSFVPKLPSEDESVTYALRFLKANKLLPANSKELNVAHIGGLRTNAVLKTGKPGRIVDKLKTITFSRELNGFPVIGAGSKIVVNIGDAGEVIGVTKRWRELNEPTRLDPSEVLTEKEARALATKQILSEFGEKSTFEIENTQVAYFDNNNAVVQPVFAFQTKIQLADRQLQAIEYVSVIPAMRKPIEELNLTAVDEKALKLISGEGSTVPDPSGKGSD